MIQTKCFATCVDKCKKTYPENTKEISSCAIKACNCEQSEIDAILSSTTDSKVKAAVKLLQPSRTWLGGVIDGLIVISLISLTVSIIMIGVMILKRRENASPEKYENNYDSINLDFSRELCEDKMIDARIFESNYELMTTEIEDEDREICIRDF
jgi:hypothetical protein